MKGRLIITKIGVNTGIRTVIVNQSNLILNLMYQQLVKLVSGESLAGYVYEMQFGTGTSVPVATEQFLQKPINPVKTVTPTIDAPNFQVVFNASLLADEGNGFPISEAGLLTKDNIVVARTVFSARSKTPDYIFDFNWTITLKS